MKVLVVTGGTTSERRISLMSAREVRKGLEAEDHKVKLFDLKKGKISKDLVKNFDVIFPVIHGEEGEGGNLQKLLSTLGKPFVGGNFKGFQQGWYKIPFKQFCDQNNILTASWEKLPTSHHSEHFDSAQCKLCEESILKFGFPAVLKSSSGGSSKEVVILNSAKDLKSKTYQKLLNSGLPLFVERFLPGTEVTVGIFNNQALPVVEIIPPKGSWFDYKNKYSGETKEIPNAPSVSSALQNTVRQIALKVHRTLNLGPYSRIDFIISDNQPYILEINTIPGLTSESLFPKAAQAVGISFPKLLDQMIKSTYEGKILKTQ